MLLNYVFYHENLIKMPPTSLQKGRKNNNNNKNLLLSVVVHLLHCSIFISSTTFCSKRQQRSPDRYILLNTLFWKKFSWQYGCHLVLLHNIPSEKDKAHIHVLHHVTRSDMKTRQLYACARWGQLWQLLKTIFYFWWYPR